MKRDRKSWKDIRIQVSLCKMHKFTGAAYTAMVKSFLYFVTFAQCLVLDACHLFKYIQKRPLFPLSIYIYTRGKKFWILANILISNTNFRNIFTLKQSLEFRPLEIKRKFNIYKDSKA